MTYPDRETRIAGHRWAIVLIVAFLLIYVAFAAEASFRRDVCISAASVELSGSVTTTPVVCR